MPEPARVFGSLPTTNLQAITIPGLANDLTLAEDAWHAGKLRRMPRHRHTGIVLLLEVFGGLCAVGVVWWLTRRGAQT